MPTRNEIKAARKATKAPAKGGRYDWGDGKGRVHSIPKSTHQQNVEARRYGIDLDAPVSGPLTNRQAYGLAEAQADREYGPQISALETNQRSAPVWFGDYVARAAAAQTAAQNYAQPLLDQANAGVTNAAQTAPGLDASSPQMAKEQEAAKGRQALATLGRDALATVPAATSAYFGGLQATAARELPQVQAMYGSQLGALRGARGAAVQSAYGGIRTGEQNAQIARDTLGLNTQKAAADVDLERGIDPVTGRPLPQDAPTGYGAGGPGQNRYGYTYDEWSGLSDAEKNRIRTAGSTKTAGKEREKEREKEKTRVEKIRKETGKLKSKVRDARTDWDRYAGMTNTVEDPVTRKPKTVKPTPAQVKQKLRDEGYTATEIHVMLMLRAGKPLTDAEVQALRDQNPDVRIPREWLKKKSTRRPNRPAPPRNDPSGYGDRPT